jgi:hypothetical protein
MPGAFPTRGLPAMPTFGRGMNPFRIGFAARAGRGGPRHPPRPLGRGNIGDAS